MATAQELTDRALQLARAFLEAHSGELTQLADGDTEALSRATRLVHSARLDAAELQRGTEHIAFTLLSAAYVETTRRYRRLHR